MLTHLAIENYALIDHLDIDFYKGFTAITGETGAGKSILVDALDLVLGKRADSQFLLDQGRKCVVEATFSIEDYNLRHFFDEPGLDYDDLAILRREVNPNGKSRAFINDTPVTLNQLKLIGDLLVDIHAQHATTSLQDPGFQLSVIDSFAGLEKELTDYQQQYLALKSAREVLKDLTGREMNARSSLDYKSFLLDELAAAELALGEQEELEEKHTLITHAEEIKSVLFQVQALLNDNENSILNNLSGAQSDIHRISAYHTGLEQFEERLKSNLIDLKDIYLELVKINESIEFSQDNLVMIQQRLDLFYRLQHKHHVNSVKELIELSEKLKLELGEYSSLENQIKETENQVLNLESGLDIMGSLLSDKRKNAFPLLQNEIVSSLRHMGIPEARFEIRQEFTPGYGFEGKDKIEFYFNANKGHSLKPLSETASGGELSRVMLSIKSIISDKKLLPTIIFDEIDNGLSGDVAGRVGDVLCSASKRMQVIAVTHLPQIAGKAQHHYSVFKQNKNNITFSNIKFLDHQERVAELAKMIGGRDISVASLAAAKELLTPTSELF
jgi:DNA repair protein RecN (Recombination protein N)